MTTQTDTSRKGTYQAGLARIRAERATRKPQEARPARKAVSGRPDRWNVLNAFVDAAMKDLGHAELAVWLVLFRDVRNGTAKTGMTDIAKRAGMTRRAVVKAMSKLRKKRLVEVVKRGHVGGSPNVYIVHGIKKT